MKDLVTYLVRYGTLFKMVAFDAAVAPVSTAAALHEIMGGEAEGVEIVRYMDCVLLETAEPPPPPPPVAPTVRIIDDLDAGFTTQGPWSFHGNQGYKGRIAYAAAGDGSAVATWTFTGLPPGRYRVSATWFHYANRAADAPYTVFADLDLLAPNIRVDQRQPPGDLQADGAEWKDLGVFDVEGNLEVNLDNDADQYVIADAVRVEGPFPADWEIPGLPPLSLEGVVGLVVPLEE